MNFAPLDVPRLVQAFVAPASFVSTSAVLLLSLNTRLMGMVSLLCQYLDEKHAAIKDGRMLEADAYASKIASSSQRAEIIRRAFVLTLLSLTGTITSCLLLGIGFRPAARPSWPPSFSSRQSWRCCWPRFSVFSRRS